MASVPQDVPVSRPRLAIPLAACALASAAAATLAIGASRNARFLHDDAYITLRYAQNWMAGNGPVWNPGERVEGYSNFLQLALVSALGASGLDLVAATRVLGGVAAALLVAFLARRAWRSAAVAAPARRVLLALLPASLVAASLPLVAWVFGGLEAPLLALLVTLGIVWAREEVRDSPSPHRVSAAGLALALACMTRLDAGLVAAVALAALALRCRLEDRARTAIAFTAPFVLLLGPWLLWKLAYYGTVVPNTYWVKAADPSWERAAQGLGYLGGLLAAPPFVIVLLALAAVRAALARRIDAGQTFVLAALGLHVLWVVYVGGDQMPMLRMWVPVLPAAVWLAWELLLPDLLAIGPRLLATASAGVALLVFAQLASPATGVANRNSTAFVGAVVGRHIDTRWPGGSLVALNTAGSTPFHAPDLRYVDMLGLNDAHIARRPVPDTRVPGQGLPGHARGDGVYVLSRRPDYLILGPANGVSAAQPWFLSDHEIAADPVFRRDYRLRQERVDVRDVPGFRLFAETRSGELRFTFYERVR